MVSLIMKNSETNYCVFAIDSSSDLPYLPIATQAGTGEGGKKINTCSHGSIARSSDGMNYMLKSDGTWVEYVHKVDEVDPITDSYVDSLFD